MSSSRAALASCLVLALASLAFAGSRVYRLERAELEHVTVAHTLRELTHAPGATRISARVTEVALRGNDRAIFELCAADGFPSRIWQNALDFVVLDLTGPKLMLRVPFDAAHLRFVRRNARGGCLLLGQGLLEHDSTYSIDAAWTKAAPSEAVMNVPLYARVLAKPELEALERGSLLALGLGVLGAVLCAFFATRPELATTTETGAARPGLAAASVALGIAALFAATQLPLFGSTLTLAKGVILLVLQIGLAHLLARGSSRPSSTTLGLVAPERRGRALVLAVLAWPVVVVTAKLSLRLFPNAGEAPIETFISWPSGMLSAALLGVFLPVGEEVFFRGFVYGSLLRYGRALAAAVSLAAFVLLHAQQVWGEWGALVAIACAGGVFTALRVATGSTWVPALTHVAYNLALSSASIFRS